MLEAAIITGLVSGFAGFLGSSLNDDDAVAKLEKEMKYIDDMYKLNKEKAELEYREAERQANKSAAEADKQADLTDLGQDIAEQTVSNDINTAIDDLYLSQVNDAWSWNNAAMSAGANTGNELAGLAASGVRAGSSLNDAILMESATNEAQLQFAQDAKRRSDNNNLAGVLNGLAGQKFNIMGNRIGADVTRQNAQDLRNSYLEGGYNYNLYELQKREMKKQRDYQYNALKDEKKKHEGVNKFWNALGSAFGLGSKGFSTGYNVAETVYEGMKYRTKIGE